MDFGNLSAMSMGLLVKSILLTKFVSTFWQNTSLTPIHFHNETETKKMKY
jgi:hypothetical protein